MFLTKLTDMKKFIPFIVFVLTFIFCACTDDLPEPESIRPFYGLIASDIPYAENMDPAFYRNPEIYGSWLVDGGAYVNYAYSWINPIDSSFINIAISITESKSDADMLLQVKKQMYETKWRESLSNDDVAVARNTSLGYGRLFTRDNIVVLIETGFIEHELTSMKSPEYSIPDIASTIDRKIKRSKTYASAKELKPAIKDIIFEKYPIPYAEAIKVELLVEPIGSILLTEFGFPPSRFDASTVTSGFLWLDTLSKIKNNEHKLCVFVVSKEGFCADSSFVIQIEP